MSTQTRTFVSFSANHLQAALFFALGSHAIEQARDRNRETENRTMVLGAIAFSVAFLEATVNECFILASEPGPFDRLQQTHREALRAVWNDSTEHLSLVSKFELALAVCRLPPFEKGKAPYQDAAALVRLRNAVVHYRDGWRTQDEPHDLEALLKNKFKPNQLTLQVRPNEFFPTHCLSYGCARWAAFSAMAFADEFYRRLDITPHYQRSVLPANGVLPESA